MRPDDYPAQDPLSDFARSYAAKVAARGGNHPGHDVQIGGDPYQSIGIHKPDNPNGSVLMFIHGGGWTNGYKEWNDFMAPALTSQGIIFISVGYRLAPRHIFPAGLQDCAGAVAWVAGHIADFGGDPGRIYLGGHSAGGHYASLLAVTDDWKTHYGLPVEVLKGCCPVSGVYRFGEGSGLAQRPRFLGEAGAGTAVAASPILRLGRTVPPFFMAHGDADFPHLQIQAQAMETALRAAGGSVQRLVLPDADHFGAHYACGEENGEWPAGVSAFIGS